MLRALIMSKIWAKFGEILHKNFKKICRNCENDSEETL